MTPKEKAGELLNKIYGETPVRSIISEIEQDRQYAKQCALIAVDEIIKANPTGEYGDPFIGNKVYDNKSYWREVKQEIEKL
jgi:hypothetical protein